MTAKLRAVTAKEVVRVAERLGFLFRRQRGSHAIYVRAIPMHAGELKRKTLRAIIQDLKIIVEDLQELL